ncbi:hypothetical protein [Streptomyces sp. NPDC017524]|uniref:hypothetical protein n=1 Tax=Streptomyces sp. NPDC017524 TaxID=3364999 RepID=UPI003794E0DB
MLKTKISAVFAAIALTVLAVPASASAEVPDEQTGLATTQVEYKGVVTTLATLEEQVGETHCHDAKGKDKLTCFATEREAELDLLTMGGLTGEAARTAADKWGGTVPKQTRLAPAAAAATCHPWATFRFYNGNNGTGSSVNLYCDYPDLSTVGWNNRANSYVCLACQSVSGTNPHAVDLMKAFDRAMYQSTQISAAKYNTLVALDASRINRISSSRLYFQ